MLLITILKRHLTRPLPEIWRRSSAVSSIAAVALSVLLAGCGPSAVTGGTPGIVTIDGEPVLDLQVVVYSAATGDKAGFGVTGDDGRFELVTEGAQGPAELEPGQYRATIESVGAPVELPPQYLDPLATPVHFDWQEDSEIEIKLTDIPLQ